MRESNYAFASQGRACICISSQLYDRRALDTTSALPLQNSLTHLTYLTNTSPRIREILTVDGGLERLVRILRDFCTSPPPPVSPTRFYGLLPPGSSITKPPKPAPGAPVSFDRGAADRFSLAFRCVVNIGVRGSEPIRSRVVQAGMLDVVGAVLEAWLLTKGFAIGPSATGSGAPRESREVRLARRLEMMEREAERLRETQASLPAELARRLHQHQVHGHSHIAAEIASAAEEASSTSSGRTSGDEVDEDMMDVTPLPPNNAYASASSSSYLTSSAGTAPIPIRNSSPISGRRGSSNPMSADTSANSTPQGSTTPTGTMTLGSRDRSGTIVRRTVWDTAATGAPGRRLHRDAGDETDMETDGEHDVTGLNATRAPVAVIDDANLEMIVGGMAIGGVEMGIEQGIITMAPNDDLAMGAPPGAPGAMDGFGGMPPGGLTPRATNDATPRARIASLDATNAPTPTARTHLQVPGMAPVAPTQGATAVPANTETMLNVQRMIAMLSSRGTASNPGGPGGPADSPPAQEGLYREEDVLLSLQLLAYLSKYPHVRQAFYKPREPFTPFAGSDNPTTSRSSAKGSAPSYPSAPLSTSEIPPRPAMSTSPNVFTLVERFTFRPSPSEPNLPPLPKEIHYWACVIMRNACRKDESRGGIRQCANMMCGRWEAFPREFAKCRRCRKAKYCGKECQSRAWAEGHRFWCSAKETEEGVPGGADVLDGADGMAGIAVAVAAIAGQQGGLDWQAVVAPTGVAPPAAAAGARRHHHHHHHHHHHTRGEGTATPTGAAAVALGRQVAQTAMAATPLPRATGGSTDRPPRMGTVVNAAAAIAFHQQQQQHLAQQQQQVQHGAQNRNIFLRVGGPRVARAPGQAVAGTPSVSTTNRTPRTSAIASTSTSSSSGAASSSQYDMMDVDSPPRETTMSATNAPPSSSSVNGNTYIQQLPHSSAIRPPPSDRTRRRAGTLPGSFVGPSMSTADIPGSINHSRTAERPVAPVPSTSNSAYRREREDPSSAREQQRAGEMVLRVAGLRVSRRERDASEDIMMAE
ncbi:hypothetical protein BOTBODRAFT_173584 [Botryobasidium botryosum FD-172 SS1]|uniref:MYND-type domain-containing protein n=1 Tax=Botryobasidium botryosum (strain FD-172 SS1) TaxID=930990 RepID=A0A067MWL2_BOTB1|nr:hypothetical protein BOTBODRAFT_173584 [Botryobasidium botryosum FD-172 SS1]